MNLSWTRRRPLWVRIVALTIFVLLMPVIGFLLLNRFGKELIAAEEQAVKAEAAVLATALEIAAVQLDPDQRLVLDMDRAMELVVGHTFAKSPNSRVRLYDGRGQLLLDSDRLIAGLLGQVSRNAPLVPRGEGYVKSFVPTLSDYQPYQEQGFGDIGFYSEVATALTRETLASGIYADLEAGRFRIQGAAAISSVQAVLGAVLVSHDETSIEAALRALNQRVFLIFLIALGIAIALALILASIIARPVRRLSQAARRLTAKDIGPAGVPTFPHRQDEIGDLALALKHMARALIERADAAEAFAAEVAHELKNPLTSLRSAAETLGRVTDPALQAKLLAVLTEDTDRLDRLISDISASSRLDAELARDEVGRADLIAVIRTFLNGQALVDPAGLGAITLQQDPDLDQALVRASPTRLVQLVQNLLANALGFCPDPAGIDLKVQWARPGWVRLRVQDRGPGLPADKLETIFKRFFTDRDQEFGKHSGLGLSIAQRIVEAAGGTIWAENREEGDGAIFIADLPLVDPSTKRLLRAEDRAACP